MYGAVPYLVRAFAIDRSEAFRIVCAWIDEQPATAPDCPAADAPMRAPVFPGATTAPSSHRPPPAPTSQASLFDAAAARAGSHAKERTPKKSGGGTGKRGPRRAA